MLNVEPKKHKVVNCQCSVTLPQRRAMLIKCFFSPEQTQRWGQTVEKLCVFWMFCHGTIVGDCCPTYLRQLVALGSSFPQTTGVKSTTTTTTTTAKTRKKGPKVLYFSCASKWSEAKNCRKLPTRMTIVRAWNHTRNHWYPVDPLFHAQFVDMRNWWNTSSTEWSMTIEQILQRCWTNDLPRMSVESQAYIWIHFEPLSYFKDAIIL